MKIRNGFVSNSSSSSFVMLVTKEAHEKALKELTAYQKAVIDKITYEETLFGREAVSFSQWHSNGGSCWEYMELDVNEELIEDGEDTDIWDIADKWKNLAIKYSAKGELFTHSEDW